MRLHDFGFDFDFPIVFGFDFDSPTVMSFHDFRPLAFCFAADRNWVPFPLIITRGDLFFVASVALIQFSSVTDRDELPRFFDLRFADRL